MRINIKTLNTDKSWVKYAKNNPYHAVLPYENFLDNKITASDKKEFFMSGEKYVDNLFNIINNEFEVAFRPESSLDFGCGTGRLTIPIAKRSGKVTGIDVSDEMLNEAKTNSEKYGVNNVSLLNSNEYINSKLKEQFDFVNSYIVFQHINEKRGRKLLKLLYDSLNNNGIGVIQITYCNDKNIQEKIHDFLRYRIPLLNGFLNVLKGRKFNFPLIQMNNYNLNKIMAFLHKSGVGKFELKFTNHGGYYGVILMFRKQKSTINM